MNYRIATVDDLLQVIPIYKTAIERMAVNGIEQWDMEAYPTNEDILRDIEKREMYVGIQNDRIVVAYTINKEADAQYQNASWSEGFSFLIVHRLCVAPEFQHQNIARETMTHIQDESRCYGIKAIHLDAFKQNPYAISLYKKLGYRKWGEAEWRNGKFNLYELLL